MAANSIVFLLATNHSISFSHRASGESKIGVLQHSTICNLFNNYKTATCNYYIQTDLLAGLTKTHRNVEVDILARYQILTKSKYM